MCLILFDAHMVDRMVRAMELSPQDVVLLHFWGEDKDLDVLRAFAGAVVAAGAAPLTLQQSRGANAALFARMQGEVFSEQYFDFLAPVNVVIDVFMHEPVAPGPDMLETAMPLYRAYMRGLFGRLMKAEKFVQVRLPTPENAAESGLSPEDFVSRMNQAYDIDYDALKAACAKAVCNMEGKDTATLRTKGCALHLSLSGRSWHVDAGTGDLPCGEVYIAPVEAETNGHVHFESLRLPEGTFEDVVLTVEKGVVTATSNEALTAFLDGLPEGGKVVCELGIGMNPGVKELVGYPVLDEKMIGTFHLGLGMNLPFGGTNESASHLDLVGFGMLTVD